MYTMAVTVVPGPHASRRDVDPETLSRVIRAHAQPDDRLQHVRSGSGPEVGSAGIVLFANADSLLNAVITARRLCDRAIEACPELSGWQVQHVDSNPL